VASFGIAVNEGKNKDGTENVTFVNLEAWEGTADFISKHFVKGNPITVQTQLRNDTWDDKSDGTKRTAAKFVVRQVSFVPGSKTNSSPVAGDDDEVVEEIEVEKPKAAPKRPASPKKPKPVEVEDDDDEIPF
jgi:single-stranded DNA-binding protein